MPIFKKSFLIVALSCLLFACGGSDETEDPTPTPTDEEAPTITITAPTANTEYLPGGTIDLALSLADDLELSSYSVDIAFKEEISATNNTPQLTVVEVYAEWTEEDVAEKSGLDGTSASETAAITIPTKSLSNGDKTDLDPQPGYYTITATVVDAAGKEASVTRDIKILKAE